MDYKLSETDRGRKCLKFDNFTFRFNYKLRNGDISGRRTDKICKASVKTDAACEVLKTVQGGALAST